MQLMRMHRVQEQWKWINMLDYQVAAYALQFTHMRRAQDGKVILIILKYIQGDLTSLNRESIHKTRNCQAADTLGKVVLPWSRLKYYTQIPYSVVMYACDG